MKKLKVGSFIKISGIAGVGECVGIIISTNERTSWGEDGQSVYWIKCPESWYSPIVESDLFLSTCKVLHG